MRRPVSTPPDLPGLTFVKLLGSGGFSDVFLYEQALPKRRVAVKVLILDELTDETRAAFAAEANLMAQLSTHPYIVTIHHADVAGDGRPYFVMEYCSGPSLGERYRRAPLDVLDALRTGVRLSSAVHTAHLAGILHRDIKPANVLSNDYGWPALTDFGISSAVDDAIASHTTTAARAAAADDTGSTGTSGPVGLSVPWSPPEMFEDEPDPDVRSDVFSLAATIWTVLAGQTPFEIKGRPNGPLDLIGRIERGTITPMTRDDVPASLVAVLKKGMATRREDRFSSALEFGRALQRVEMELGYARTELEVPNMYVEAPARLPEGDDADETRVRQVATIEAQPVEPPAPSAPAAQPAAQPASPFAPPPAPSSADPSSAEPLLPAGLSTPPAPVAEDTVMRTVRVARPAPAAAEPAAAAAAPVASAGPLLVDPPPAPELPPVAPAPPPAPKRPLGMRIAGIVVGALALLVTAAVVIGLVLTGGVPAEPEPTTPPTASAAPAVPTRIAPPEAAGAPAPEGAGVAFPVTNPDPQDGDALVWRLANRPDQPGLRPVEGDRVLVEEYAAGSTVCVEVMVLRKGKTSEPFTACYPS